jgi:hypothetical protein
MLRLICGLCTLFLLGIVVHSEHRQQPKSKDTAESAKSSTTGTPAAGVVVVVDPVTRQILPATAADIQTLSPPAAAAVAPAAPPDFTEIQGPGGAVGLLLGPSFQINVVATKAADGTLQMKEAAGEKAAEQTVNERASKSGDGK